MNYGSKLQRWLFHSSPPFMRDAAASLYGWKQKRSRQGKHFHEHLRRLTDSQWLSNVKARELQTQKLKAFLEYAGEHSPYWRALFQQHGFAPSAMRSPFELSALPILDKDTARRHMNEIVTDDPSGLNAAWSHTSGTTGRGLRFLESAECLQREFAFRVLTISWAGVRFGERWAYCAGHPVAPPESTRPPFWVRDRTNNWLLMSSYHLTEGNLPLYIRELTRFQPALIAGYPSSVYLLAVANLHANRAVRPRAVLTSSETLFDHQRRVMEDSFGCKAYSYYGNAERAAVSGECEKGRHHLQLEHSYVEILDSANNPVAEGSEGRLVCTGFGNYATPLIRYEIGDMAVLSREQECPCGRNGILLERIQGRMEDYVVTPDGRFAGRLDHLFKDSVNVRLAQIQQDTAREIVIRVVKEPAYGPKDEKAILDEARARLGNAIGIRFEYVADIPRTSNGKFRFVVSNVAGKHLFDRTL